MQSNSGHHPIPLFWYLGFHVNAILNFINTPKASTHYGEYSYVCFMKFDEKSKKKIKSPPFFISMATAAKFVQLIAIFLAYLVPVNVDVTGNITAKLCEVGSEFNIFCTLVTMATASILNLFNPQNCQTLRWIFLQSLMKLEERNPIFF